MKTFKIAVCLLLVFSLTFCFAGCKDSEDKPTQESTGGTTYEEDTEYSEGDGTYSEYSEPDTIYSEPDFSEENSTEKPATTVNATVNTTVSTTVKPTVPQTTQKPETTAPVNTTGVGSYTKNYDGRKQIVFYPNSMLTSNKTLPVISWANGTGFSYDIYEKLLKKLAEGGYIVVASDETMSADGTAQISSLDFIISENSNSSSVLYKKVNTQKLAAVGHSQGGRSSVNAAAKDSRILCAISFAGSNFVEEAEALSAPTLFFAGEKDLIVNAKRWVIPAYDACKGPAVYVSLKSGGHTACCTNPETYSDYALSWLDIWLKNDSSAKNIFKNGGDLSKDSDWTGFRCKGL